MITFDASLLTNLFQSQLALQAASTKSRVTTSGGSGGGKAAPIPTAPWSSSNPNPVDADAVMRKVLLGGKFIDVNAAKLDVAGASDDYKKLFALYQGLDTLSQLAARAQDKTISASELKRVQAAFDRGLAEIGAFTDSLKLEQLRLSGGQVSDKLNSTSGVKVASTDYVTDPIHQGGLNDEVAAFTGEVKFNIDVQRLNSTFSVPIDLTEMGAQPRTIGNVVGFINTKLQEAGVYTRFSAQQTPSEPRTMQIGGKTVTLPALGESWALKVKGDVTEKVTFSAPQAGAAVYLAQQAGKVPSATELKNGAVNDVEQQLVKLQTGAASRLFADGLPEGVSTVHSTVTGADGSVYLLADVTGPVDGQAVKGEGDVALLKYDSAGHLQFTRTLGAAGSASGLSLAVADDGRIAVAGSVQGQLAGAANGPTNSTDGSSDSFVTLFDAKGDEVWTARRGVRGDDAAQAVAFGPDGVVYVAGRTNGALPGASAVGGYDNYLTAFATQADGTPKALFTTQFGTTGDDKISGIAVNGGQVVVAGVESGAAVVRSFDVATTAVTTTKSIAGGVYTKTVESKVSGVVTDTQTSTFATTLPDSYTSSSVTTAATLTAGAVRNLGGLAGGDLAGVGFLNGEVIVAGTSLTGALNAGTVTSGYSGGADAFVAKLAGDLSAQPTDRITFYGGDGADTAKAMTIADGKVWITGSSSSATLNGAAKIGTSDGYVAELDPDAGSVAWSTRFTAKEGVAAPNAIAVDVSGASILDTLGLPKGTLDFSGSNLLTSNTSVRAGDQFFIRTSEGGRQTAVTIEADETLDSLAQKVRRAAGYAATVSVVKKNGVSTLQIKPANDHSTIEIIPGKIGLDALESLGLSPGVARVSGGDAEKDKKIYGLGLLMDMSLDSAEAAKTAGDNLSNAMLKIRSLYRDLQRAADPQSDTPAVTGTVPAYLQAQLANYQAGLARLGVTG